MRDRKRMGYRLAVPLVSGVLAISCGSDSDDPAVGGIFNENSATKVDSLASIPDIGNLLVALDEEASLQQGGADAVVGTPPNFKDINRENVEEFLIEPISGIVSAMTTAVAGNDWDTFDAERVKFEEGQRKCYVMQDAARQLGELGQASGSACYMKRVDQAEGARGIEYVSGEEVAQGQYFTPTEATQYRALQLEGGEEEGAGGETIIFEIQGTSVEAGVYQVSLNFCDDSGEIRSKETIRVDNNAGLMTFSSTNKGTEENQGESHSYAGEVLLTAGLTVEADGTISFDPASERKMEIKGKDSSSNYSNSYNGSISIADSKLTTKFIHKGSSFWDSKTFEFSEQSASVVRYSGSKMSDIKIFEAAGKRQGTFKESGVADPFSHSGEITFEFDEGKSPKYNTVATTELKTALDLISFTEDELLKQETITEPGTIDDSACSQTPSSVYKLNLGGEVFSGAQSECEAHFNGGGQICETIRNRENEVYEKIFQRDQVN